MLLTAVLSGSERFSIDFWGAGHVSFTFFLSQKQAGIQIEFGQQRASPSFVGVGCQS